MAFQLARRTRTVVRMVPGRPESGFRGRVAGLGGRQRVGRQQEDGRGVGRWREGYAGRWEVKLDNIAALAAEREQLARTPEGGSRGGVSGLPRVSSGGAGCGSR